MPNTADTFHKSGVCSLYMNDELIEIVQFKDKASRKELFTRFSKRIKTLENKFGNYFHIQVIYDAAQIKRFMDRQEKIERRKDILNHKIRRRYGNSRKQKTDSQD